MLVNIVVITATSKNDDQNNGLFDEINNAIFTDASSAKLREAFDLNGVVRLRVGGKF